MRSARDQMVADQLVVMGFVPSDLIDATMKEWEGLSQTSATVVPLVPFLIQKQVATQEQMDLVLNALKQSFLKLENKGLARASNTRRIVNNLMETTNSEEDGPPPPPKINKMPSPVDDFQFESVISITKQAPTPPTPPSPVVMPKASTSQLDLSLDSDGSSSSSAPKNPLMESTFEPSIPWKSTSPRNMLETSVPMNIVPPSLPPHEARNYTMDIPLPPLQPPSSGYTMDIVPPSLPPQDPRNHTMNVALPPLSGSEMNVAPTSFEKKMSSGPETKPIGVLPNVMPPGPALPPTDEDLLADAPPSLVSKESMMQDFSRSGGDAPVAADRLTGTAIAGYKLEKILGKGAMGVVYLAENIGLRRKVAVKILPSQMTANPKKVKQFFREGRAAAKLEHPNVIQMYQVGEERGIYFLVMEYVEGVNLKQIIKEKHLIEVNTAIEYFLQTCEGLQCAHSYNIIHRDIKPENIMIKAGTNAVKVADFGIAKQQDEEDSNFTVNESGHLVGTPAYMSPEQIDGQKIDIRSDIYSMGVMFYYMLIGREPHIGETPVKTLLKHLSEPLSFPENHGLPNSLVNIIKKMMAKRREERYNNIAEVIRDLNDFKKGKEVKQEVESKPLTMVLQKEIAPIKREEPFSKAKWVGVGFAALYLFVILIFKFAQPSVTSKLEGQKFRWEEAQQAFESIERYYKEVQEEARDQRFYEQMTNRLERFLDTYPSDVSSENADKLLVEVLVQRRGAARNRFALIKKQMEEKMSQNQHGQLLLALDRLQKAFPREDILLKDVESTRAEIVKHLLEKTGEVFIPSGEIVIEGKLQKIAPFYISAYEVTNEEYAKFLQTTQKQKWEYPEQERQAPVTNVSFEEAQAYATWKNCRLPTEGEWEWAARGSELYLWPWGNDYFPRAHLRDLENPIWSKAPVFLERYQRDQSPFKVFGCAGNVHEWVASVDPQYPEYHLYKGGSYLTTEKSSSLTQRGREKDKHFAIGFRLARDIQ